MGICIVDGCTRPWRRYQMCEMHSQRFAKYGDPTVRMRIAKGEIPICRVHGCGEATHALGCCVKHYQRLKTTGDPVGTKIRPHGYGSFNGGYHVVTRNGRKVKAHRVIMETILGRPLLPHEIVHHIDGNKLNNAPSNLQVMSQSDHIKHSPTSLSALAEGRKRRWPRQRGA